jgi:protein SCO1
VKGAVPILAGAVILMAVTACSRAPTFRGTALDPPRATLDFALTDQRERTVRWSDFRGRVVILTFLYTSCRDVCPLVTQELREASELLGNHRSDVAIVAVTVDPARDTIARAAAYSQEWRMAERWEFLTGREADLAPSGATTGRATSTGKRSARRWPGTTWPTRRRCI